MSFLLKHIPCPAGNKCTAFHCIFGHGNDESPAKTTADAPVARDNVAQQGHLEDSPANEDGPRKRVKTDPVSNPAPKTADNGKASSSTSTNLQSTKRPVSPPPLKRKLPLPVKHQPVPSAKPSAPAAGSQSRPSPAPKPSQQKPKKVESLNPRLLKSNPASYEIRLRLLKMLNSEFMRLNTEVKKASKDGDKALILSDQDLIVRALDKEEHTAIHKAAVYPNVMKNMVMQYKRMKVDEWKTERKEDIKKAKGQNDAPEPPKKLETGLTPLQELEIARRILTPIDDLSVHGYVPIIPSDEDIEKAKQGVEASKGWEKCDRCQQRFQVFPGRREEDGALTSGGSCTFHWGKAFYPSKTPGDQSRKPKRYLCCGQDVGDSVGCYTDDHHVFKTTDPKRLASVLNFVETPENPLAPTDRAVAFDCEMGYTVHGMELIRLTATSWPTGEELLDVLVRPIGEILDLNSRYSGVWPDDLAQAEPWTGEDELEPTHKGPGQEDSEDGETTRRKKTPKIVSSPEIARSLLFSLISPSTPLIGHGLENDLNTTRIVHPTLIDTILLYPSPRGLPGRLSLKHLMDVHLDRKIQQETGPKMLGHDSAEDARAAGDLVRLKVKHKWMDMQMEGWKLVDGNFMDPKKNGIKEGKLTEEFIER
ncbi:hypothetical protein BGZ63DRAFT_370650 [Mariannaea sp. PMI_226]|nr:hypothetical protein BGZ63DRAFT_370650 [Mariannaea sp. PMI_226]